MTPVLLVVLLLGGDTAASPAPPPAAVAARGADPDYRVGVGDVLDITVFGNEDLSRSTTVQTNGTISFPLLGEVPVAELSVAEIKGRLTSLLGRDYLVNPQVDVKVREYQSQFVILVGELNSPGRKPLRGRTRIIDILVEAGGFTARASGEIVITRSEGTFEGGSKTLTLRLGGAAMNSQDEVNLQVQLRKGDIVSASPRYYVTVEGEINRPGRFVIEGDLTVTGAISSAGGLTRFGSTSVKVRRTDPQTGRAQIIDVDLKAVRQGKKPDLLLAPNDVVTISRKLF